MPNDTTFDWPMLCSIDPQYENTWLIWKLSCYMRRRYKISSSRNLLANVLIGWYFRVSNTLNWTKDMWNRCCCIVFVGTSTNLRHSSSNGLLFPQTYKFLQCIIKIIEKSCFLKEIRQFIGRTLDIAENTWWRSNLVVFLLGFHSSLFN